MNSEEWKALNQAFEHASNLSQANREKFLEQLKVDSEELYYELQGMLANDGQPSIHIHQSVNKAANSALTNKEMWIGKEFGTFVIVREIASGGMGSVFLGERKDSDFQQKVAIKVLQTVLASETTISYFENERKILASLNHPNIGSLYDGGTTPEGLPYLVMEYIDGQPINQYCQQNNLSINQKIKLFIQVCSAVEHAHRNLIVHRDIKPSNILIDQQGIPKLLDFGIAKELVEDPYLTDNTLLGKYVLTPAYASPEQVKGEVITTSSDVYSLGVLLYQLLTGEMPYKMKQGSPVEIISSICQTQPSRPSLSNKTEATKLKGDLDSIILYALNKEPERRYLSVLQLKNDLESWLKGNPVMARGDSRIYKLNKFVRRNIFSVSTAALLFISSIVFSYYSYQQAQTIEREKYIAEQVTDFIASIFSDTNPDYLSKDPTVKELLKGAIERLDEEFDQLPEVKLRLQLIIAASFSNMGEYKILDELFEKARPLVEQRSLPPELLEYYYRLVGISKKSQDKYQESLIAHEQALEIARAELNGTEIHAFAILAMANIKAKLNEKEQATLLYQESLKIIDRILLQNNLAFRSESIERLPLERSKALYNYTIILFQLGKFSEALETLKEVLMFQEQHFGKETPHIANAYDFMGVLEREANQDRQKAKEYHLRAIQIYEKVYDPKHINIAHILSNLGLVYRDSNEPELTLEAFNRALNIFKEKLGTENYQVGRLSVLIAREKIGTGELDEAKQLLDSADSIYKQTIPELHSANGFLKKRYAQYYEALGKLDVALEFLFEVDELFAELYTKPTIYTVENKLLIVRNYLASQNNFAAKIQLEKAKLINNQLAPSEQVTEEIIELEKILADEIG